MASAIDSSTRGLHQDGRRRTRTGSTRGRGRAVERTSASRWPIRALCSGDAAFLPYIYDSFAAEGYRWFAPTQEGKLQACPRTSQFGTNLLAFPDDRVAETNALQ